MRSCSCSVKCSRSGQAALALAGSFGVGMMALAATSTLSHGQSDGAFAAAQDAGSSDSVAILRQAFRNQYEVDITATIELIVRNSAGAERRRVVEAASKIIEDRMHSIGRLTAPEHLRGTTILQIEGVDGSNNTFIYFPSTDRARRISTAQRDDSFLGTDVTYEDLERHHVESYEVESFGRERIQSEPVYRIGVRPREPRSYAKALFWIAEQDYAIFRVEYFKDGSKEPYRIVSAPRSSMQSRSGHVLPSRLEIDNRRRRTTTDVTYRDLEVDPEIDDRIFSIRTLEQRRPLSGP